MINISTHIETPNLLLRVLKLSDTKALQKILEENKEYMLPYISWAKNEPQTIVEKQLQIREWTSEFYADTKYVYGAFNNVSNELVGLVFIFTRQGANILEIGYIINFRHTGKGYATECSYALTKLCFDKINIKKVVIICSDQNLASAKIPEKLGYNLEYNSHNEEKNQNDNRKEEMVWVIFNKEFKKITHYEPIKFVNNKKHNFI